MRSLGTILIFVDIFNFLFFCINYESAPIHSQNTPSYSNKHNVWLQYIVQFSKLLSKMWSIFTNCFWVQIFKNLKFLKFEWKFRHQILGKIIIMHLLKILAFVATITAINNYHGTNQKRENRFLTNQKAAVNILA